tara:strand:- start:34129 stop:35511 length:1383 start_codon:yes stop_codon:yes gene_type:complete
MKKFFSFLSVAFLGGIVALGAYKAFLEEPVVIQQTSEQPIQTFQTNFKPAFETTDATYAPTDFTIAAEKTVHAVVHVKNTAVKSGLNSWSDIFNGPRKYEQVGTGSGVIISSDGYIVTNNHVIANATNLEITLNNRKKYKAELIGTDAENDIALLKINADGLLPYIPFSNSDNLKIGEWVLAVGNPYNLTSTVTAGIISAKGRDLQGNSATDSFIQTDAAVNPGNSGGALVNTRGELVGINTAISSRTGSYVGYSFAVPSNIAKKIIDDILEFGKVQEAIIGINYDPSTDNDINGVKITGVTENGGAIKAGLKAGDVIVKINDVKITKFSELSGQLKAKRPGESVNVTVDRGGSKLIKTVKLTEKTDQYISNAFQIELKDLDKTELKEFDISGGAKVIREAPVGKGGSSLIGYVITKINGKSMTTASETAKLLDNLTQRGYRIRVEMITPKGEVEQYVFR